MAAKVITNPWTEADVRSYIAVAARTLRWLKWDRPRGYSVRWPEVAQDFWAAHNNARELGEKVNTRVAVLPPEPHDIDTMDQAIPWLYWIRDKRIRDACLLYGELDSYELVAINLGMSKEWCRKADQAGIAIIMAMLKRGARGAVGRTI